MKEFLSRKGIEYEVKDVHSDETAQMELSNLGFTAIPVTIIDDGEPILGADFKKIEAALPS